MLYIDELDAATLITNRGKAFVLCDLERTLREQPNRTNSWRGFFVPCGQGDSSEHGIGIGKREKAPLEIHGEGLERPKGCVAWNSVFQILAISVSDGLIDLVRVKLGHCPDRGRSGDRVRDFAVLAAERLKSLALPQQARITCLKYSRDSRVLAVGARGVFVWSVWGRKLIDVTERLLSHELSHKGANGGQILERVIFKGIKDLEWSNDGNSLLLLPEEALSSLNTGPKRLHFSLSLARHAFCLTPTLANLRSPSLIYEDKVKVFAGGDGREAGDPASFMLDNLARDPLGAWRCLQIPHEALVQNYPIKHASIDENATYLALGGLRGFMHCNIDTARWKVFRVPEDEQEITVTGGLAWKSCFLFVACRLKEQDQLVAVRRDANLELSALAKVIDFERTICMIDVVGNKESIDSPFRSPGSDPETIYLWVMTEEPCLHVIRLESRSTSRGHAVGRGTVLFSVNLDHTAGLPGPPALPEQVLVIRKACMEARTRAPSDISMAISSALVGSPSVVIRSDAMPSTAACSRERDTLRPEDILLYAVRGGELVQMTLSSQNSPLSEQIDNMWFGEGYRETPKVTSLHIDSLVEFAITSSTRADEVTRRLLWIMKGEQVVLIPEVLHGDQESMAENPTSPVGGLRVHVRTSHYPFAPSFQQGLLFGLQVVASFSRPISCMAYDIEVKVSLFIQHLLEALLLYSSASESVLFASMFESLPHFQYALEVLLHSIWERHYMNLSDIASESLLKKAINLLQHFPRTYLGAIASCMRKSDVRHWQSLLRFVESPQDLFDSCLAMGLLRTATAFMMIIHTLEPWNVGGKDTVVLLQRMLEEENVALAGDLLRFLATVGAGAKVDTWEVIKRRQTLSIKEVGEESAGDEGQSHSLLTLINCHALSLLQKRRMRALAQLRDALGFPITNWLQTLKRSNKYPDVPLEDLGKVFISLHRQFSWSIDLKDGSQSLSGLRTSLSFPNYATINNTTSESSESSNGSRRRNLTTDVSTQQPSMEFCTAFITAASGKQARLVTTSYFHDLFWKSEEAKYFWRGRAEFHSIRNHASRRRYSFSPHDKVASHLDARETAPSERQLINMMNATVDARCYDWALLFAAMSQRLGLIVSILCAPEVEQTSPGITHAFRDALLLTESTAYKCMWEALANILSEVSASSRFSGQIIS